MLGDLRAHPDGSASWFPIPRHQMYNVSRTVVSWILSSVLLVYLWEGKSSPLHSILAGSRSPFLHLQTKPRPGAQTAPTCLPVTLPEGWGSSGGGRPRAPAAWGCPSRAFVRHLDLTDVSL